MSLIIKILKRILTQKLEGQFGNVVGLFQLSRRVSHVFQDATKLLPVVVGVGDVGEGLGKVGLTVRGLIGLAGGDVSLEISRFNNTSLKCVLVFKKRLKKIVKKHLMGIFGILL
jgi:hypothetical protein